MPGRWSSSSESRWSSERERQELERKREEFAKTQPKPPRRSWREGTAGARRDEPAEEQGPAESTTYSPSGPIPVGRKWRDSAPGATGPERELPNLPGDTGGRDRRNSSTIGKGLLIFTALLFVAMGVLAFTPVGPLGGDNTPDPTMTATMSGVVPTNAAASQQNPQNNPDATEPAAPSNGAVVCIDPGHGGWDPGFERMDPDTYDPPYFTESQITLAVSLMLRDRLVQDGYTVVMTRETGTAVNVFDEDINGNGKTHADSESEGKLDEWQARINVCNEANADILVSVHANGYTSQDARGFETIYTKERPFGQQNLDLASFIWRQIGSGYESAGFETQARGAKADTETESASMDSGASQHILLIGPEVENADYTLVPSAMPGAIVESVFITNDEDARFIALASNQQILANAIADGIEEYFQTYPPTSTPAAQLRNVWAEASSTRPTSWRNHARTIRD